MKQVRYRVSLVTYVDILGFKALIEERSPGHISRVIRVVKEAVQPPRFRTALKEIPDDQYVNFSDLSIIATPLEGTRAAPSLQLFSQLMRLVYAQSTLLIDEGILMRGAITIGEVVKSWGQLFGPAVVRAYELERDFARHPRIVVDDKIFRVLDGLPHAWYNGKREDKRALRDLIRKDDDGISFVDYLWALRSELNDPSLYPVWLAQHQDFITKGLKKHARNAAIRAKYEWLAGYHHATIARIKKHP